ncbi:helix-turn-helix domain-containing protein [Streptomyces sp. 12297]
MGEPRVYVPAELAATTFSALALYLADRTRANGGALTPEARTLLRALHAAAQGTGVGADHCSSEGSGTSNSPTLGANEVADVLGCSRRWATHLLSSGRLVAWRVGRTWITTQGDLDRYRYRFGEETPDESTPAGQPT